MPYVSGQIVAGGAVVDLLVGVSRMRREALQRVGFPIPARVPIRAVIDTGSSVTGIDPTVLQQLDIRPVGERAILTPSTGHTPHRCNVYDVGLSLRHPDLELHFYTSFVIESIFGRDEGVQALIGRDVLAHCLFVYDGQCGTFSLAF
jgi:hypothetical protein